jgi:hypothetical protein
MAATTGSGGRGGGVQAGGSVSGSSSRSAGPEETLASELGAGAVGGDGRKAREERTPQFTAKADR